MDTFERIVLGIAFVLLIAALTVMGVSMGKHTGLAPQQSACPDFWYSSYYEPCASTPYGCCTDGVTAANANGTSCTETPCSLTAGGCCPDGVTTIKDGVTCPISSSKCYNVENLITTCPNSMDFTPDKYVGSGGLCEKQNWAKKCGLNWDGVSNVANAC